MSNRWNIKNVCKNFWIIWTSKHWKFLKQWSHGTMKLRVQWNHKAQLWYCVQNDNNITFTMYKSISLPVFLTNFRARHTLASHTQSNKMVYLISIIIIIVFVYLNLKNLWYKIDTHKVISTLRPTLWLFMFETADKLEAPTSNCPNS